MAHEYSNKSREQHRYALPDIEVFHVTPEEAQHDADMAAQQDDPNDDLILRAGFYWRACLPGCLPDGDASGPFPTYADALADARRDAPQDDDWPWDDD